jgi:iron-sulfur cluster assembly accessory protein|tara:strand:+ start:3715 stop:4107 length:393 start_codon:yes stop_codon:yes gene_type:complete
MDCPVDGGVLSETSISEDFEIAPINVILTEIATNKLRDIFNTEPGDVVLTLAVHRGGCSGYLYDMQIGDKPEPVGHQFDDVNGIPVAISDFDSSLLAGIVIDFQDSLMGGGFKIENPNASKACSCGSSFN